MSPTTQGSDSQSTDQRLSCVDEGPSRCRAIDAVLSQAYIHDILQQMKSAYKLSAYGIPVHLAMAAVAAIAFWSGASSEILIIFFCQQIICVFACGLAASRSSDGLAAAKAAMWGLPAPAAASLPTAARPVAAATPADVAVDIAPVDTTRIPAAAVLCAPASPPATASRAHSAGASVEAAAAEPAPQAALQTWKPPVAIVSLQMLVSSLLLITFIFYAFYYFWPDYIHDRDAAAADGTPVPEDTSAVLAAHLSPLLCAAVTACVVLCWLAHEVRACGRALDSDLLRVAAATFTASAVLAAGGFLLVVLIITRALSLDGSDRWLADSALTLTALIGLLAQAATWWRHLMLHSQP